jgi:hypothetical protein
VLFSTLRVKGESGIVSLQGDRGRRDFGGFVLCGFLNAVGEQGMELDFAGYDF